MAFADIWDRLKLGSPQECWPFLGAIDSRGYGHLRVGPKTYRAHRVAYAEAYGAIPAGKGYHGAVVRHACDNRLCCNPNHLKLGTHADNMADMRERGRRKGIASGEKNGRAVLTDDQVREIRADPRGKVKLSREYGVSPAQIQRIRAGKQRAA